MVDYHIMKTIRVVDYDPNWPNEFKKLKSMVKDKIDPWISDIEHVGSTSVVGLAAKPIIDMVIVGDLNNFEQIKAGLGELGYFHNGDQGVIGREVFKLVEGQRTTRYRHHLYFCDPDADELTQFRAFLSYLNDNPDVRDAYGQIKKEAAHAHPHDINGYMDYKGSFIAQHLTKALNSQGYIPKNSTTWCQSCNSSNIDGEIQINYLRNGLKSEIFRQICKDCGASWEKEI